MSTVGQSSLISKVIVMVMMIKIFIVIKINPVRKQTFDKNGITMIISTNIMSDGHHRLDDHDHDQPHHELGGRQETFLISTKIMIIHIIIMTIHHHDHPYHHDHGGWEGTGEAWRRRARRQRGR